VAVRKKFEGHCSTSQSLQWAVVPMEEEEEEEEDACRQHRWCFIPQSVNTV